MRKTIALILAIVLFAPVSLYAQQNTTRFFTAYDYVNLTVDATAGGVAYSQTEIQGSKAQSITFTVTCASGTDCPIRITLDGTTVTASVGIRFVSGQSATVYGNNNITRLRAIREGATSAVLNTQFFQ